MNKIKEFIKNISPFNNRTDMPKLLYVIKVILIFWVFKFGAELVGEGIVLAIHFACGKRYTLPAVRTLCRVRCSAISRLH